MTSADIVRKAKALADRFAYRRKCSGGGGGGGGKQLNRKVFVILLARYLFGTENWSVDNHDVGRYCRNALADTYADRWKDV